MTPTKSSPGAVPSSVATATSSSTPTAAPSADLGRAAVTSFIALVTKEGFSYQATFSGESRHTTDILPISKGVLQVSGDDVLVRATFTFPRERNAYVVEHRLVGGKAWIRDGQGAWRRLSIKATDTMSAFASVRMATDVTYLGPTTSGGKTLYEVQFRSAIVHPLMIPATNLSEPSLTTPKLRLLIDATGRPISGTAEIVGRGRISGQLQEIVIDLKMAFTKVGQAVSIKAP